MQSEFVPVAKDFKAHVIGRKGYVIEDIRQRSGAQIWSSSTEEEGFTVSGSEEQIACAKRLILEKVVSFKDKCHHSRIYIYISERHDFSPNISKKCMTNY